MHHLLVSFKNLCVSLMFIMLFSQYLSLPIILTTVAIFLIWLTVNWWKNNQNLPPGPWGLPFFGYYFFLSSKPYLEFDHLAKRYGDVFSFRTIGGKLFVVLSGAKLIKEILVNRAEEFIGRPQESNLLEWISDGLGVTQEEGSSWKEHRRFFLQTVKNFGFGKLEIEESIHDQIRILTEDLKKTQGKPTYFEFHVAYAVNSIISQILFSRKFEKNGEFFPKLVKGVHHLIKIFADNRFMLVGPFFQYIAMMLFPSSSEVRKGRALLKRTVENIIEDHVKTFNPSHLRDYVDVYLDQRRKLEKSEELQTSSFTMDRLRAISMNMMMEGTESVTSALTTLLTAISKHPVEQKLAQEELDAVVGKERLPSWLDRQNLPYLEATIQELYRTDMPFYISTHYCNFNETNINGYRIPQRSILIANLYTINNDPDIFPDPKRFDPKRFLGENNKKLKLVGPYPFGIGKRSCIGESLAQMEVFLIIASLLQNFTLLPGDGNGTLRAIPRN